MAQTYKVTAISPKKKEWEGGYGPMVDYYVKLEGVDAPVVITKKPDSRPPQDGDELFGTLDMGGKFGPKFKAERQQGFGGGSSGGGGGSKPSYQPKDEKAIQAMWAIGQAVTAYGPMPAEIDEVLYTEKVGSLAARLFALVEPVKAGETPAETPDDKVTDKELDKIFGTTDVIDEDEVPFP